MYPVVTPAACDDMLGAVCERKGGPVGARRFCPDELERWGCHPRLRLHRGSRLEAEEALVLALDMLRFSLNILRCQMGHWLYGFGFSGEERVRGGCH